jgi:hypothetical protein
MSHSRVVAMSGILCIAALISSCAGAPPRAERQSRELETGLKLYRQNQIAEALPFFERAVATEDRDPAAYAWLGETYRRLGRRDAAVANARIAIELDPCSSFAHTVLADSYNPQFSGWERANADTTWHHLLKAVACDSSDGNAWFGVWTEAMRRGAWDTEARTLRMLVQTGFLTRAALAYGRWLLSYLPTDALLIVNGDMDTYPPLALQEVEQLRTDVVVVNASLLNTAWYPRYLRDRHRLMLPFDDAGLESLMPRMDENKKMVTVATQILRGWLTEAKEARFSRPIAVSTTIADRTLFARDHLELCGAYWLWKPQPFEHSVDTATVRMSLAGINPDDFAGSAVSAKERSSVLLVSSDKLSMNITGSALQYGDELRKAKRFDEAAYAVQWAERFESTVCRGPDPVLRRLIESSKKAIEEERQKNEK